jgi:hypothetical protein
MKSRKLVLWGVLSVLLGLCLLCGIRNRPYLTDPPQDSLDLTWHRDIHSEVDPMDLEALYALAREVVDEWSPDAYLYSVHLNAPCTNLAALQTVYFTFLKVNHLDIYTKQWYAFVDLDFEDGEVTLQVEKEEQDPPPRLQKRLDLSRLAISLSQALEIASQVESVGGECLKAHISLYKYLWDISYVDERLIGPSERYPGVKIDALTGEVEWREGRK